VVSGSTDNSLRVWDTENGVALQVIKTDVPPFCLTTMSGDRVVTGCRDGLLRVWDYGVDGCLKTQRLTLKGHKGYVGCLVRIPNGKLISGGQDGLLRVWV